MQEATLITPGLRDGFCQGVYGGDNSTSVFAGISNAELTYFGDENLTALVQASLRRARAPCASFLGDESRVEREHDARRLVVKSHIKRERDALRSARAA